MTNYDEALHDAKQSCLNYKSAAEQLAELDALMRRGDYQAADQLMLAMEAANKR